MNAITGSGILHLLSTFTMIGARYGTLSPECVDSVLPHPSTLTRKMSDLAATTKVTLGNMLVESFKTFGGAITLDTWTDNMKKIQYMSVTAHFIIENETNLVLNDRILAVKGLAIENKKSGQYLRTELMNILTEFKLHNYVGDKIIFVSDRGPNVICAVKDFQSINCFAHLCNNVVEKNASVFLSKL